MKIVPNKTSTELKSQIARLNPQWQILENQSKMRYRHQVMQRTHSEMIFAVIDLQFAMIILQFAVIDLQNIGLL